MKPPRLDNKHIRVVTILISVLGILALILLTSSVSNLMLLPGETIDIDQIVLPLPENFFHYFDLLLSICVSGIVIIIPILILLLTSSAKAREILQKNMIGLFGFLLLLIIMKSLLGMSDESAEPIEQPLEIGSQSEVDNLNNLSPDSEEIGSLASNNLPGWQGYIVGFIIFMSLGIVVFIIWERNRSIKYELNKIALKTMEEIKSGQEWEDAVIRCYSHMSSVVSRKRNLDRKGSMTPLEFSNMLIKSGLPEAPVKSLTQLFEKARYSNRRPQTTEANEAVACLSQITHWLEISE